MDGSTAFSKARLRSDWELPYEAHPLAPVFSGLQKHYDSVRRTNRGAPLFSANVPKTSVHSRE